MATFTPRTTRPANDNRYYIKTTNPDFYFPQDFAGKIVIF